MERFAWKGRIKPGMRAEYQRRHDQIWPEMKELLKSAGIRNYTIWTDGETLFGYYECEKGIAFAEKTQAGSPIVKANAIQGPIHPTLGIAMDMSIQLKAANGAICTLSLSFNNDGPLGTFFRYIGDTATYIARYDDLVNGKEEKIDVSKVDVSMNGIELQDREFFAAIKEGREPNASVAQVLPCYQVLHNLELQLNAG